MRQRRRSLLSSAVLAICVSGPGAAADPLGLYVGGSIGQAQIAAHVSDPFNALSDRFKKNHFALKVVVGLRPISLFGAELSCMDVGHPGGARIETAHGASGIINALTMMPIPDGLPVAALAEYSSESSKERVERREKTWTPLEKVV
jgi:opacity protein-like surface antigen